MQYITTPHDAELNAARLMQGWGFTDAVATTAGADGGIDVRSSRALAQVKWQGGAAGRPDVQRLYGARGTDVSKQLFFFAASSYSKAAIEYADLVDVLLFTYDPTGKSEPANKHATTFLKSVGQAPPRVVLSRDDKFIGTLVLALLILMAALIWLVQS